MRLAFYTYSYTDRLNMPMVPALEKIAATGYDSIDISGTHGKSADPHSVTPELREQTRSTAERLGLKIEAIITHATLADSLFTDTPLDLEGSVDLAVDVGAPLVVFHMGGPKNDEAKRADAMKRVIDYLKGALDYAEQNDVALAVDGVWKDWLVETPESFLKLHDDIGSRSFGINFDPCYLVLLGLDPVWVAGLWGERIMHAHLKDHVGTHPSWEHKIPGRGVVDYPIVVQALKEIGFEDALSIETFTDMDFVESCEIGFASLAPLMAPNRKTGRTE
jgi:sugar phosphate isomerase/epimerase